MPPGAKPPRVAKPPPDAKPPPSAEGTLRKEIEALQQELYALRGALALTQTEIFRVEAKLRGKKEELERQTGASHLQIPGHPTHRR